MMTIDWMEWKANGVAPYILMPTATAKVKIKIEQLLKKYQINLGDSESKHQIEEFRRIMRIGAH